MNEHVNPVLSGDVDEPPRFEAYTAFGAVEQALETHLGADSKLQLPAKHQESFVRFLPWVALVFLPFQLGAVLLLLGISALAALFGSPSIFGAVISTGVFVLDVIALPGLFARTRRGWTFYLYALALSTAGNLISFSLFGLAISVGLFWLAFQVKYKYR